MLRTMGGTMDGARDPQLDGWSDALYRTLVEQIPAVVYIDSGDQRPDSLYLSPQVQELLQHPPDAYIADPELWRRQTHPEDVPRIAETWRRARLEERPFECEYRMIRGDGTVIWVRDDAVPMRDDEGNVAFWQGVVYQVTEQKRYEQELHEARERSQALVENLPAVVYLVAPDDDRRTLYVSPRVELALGYTREEWLAQPDIWMELLHPDDREPTLAAHDLHNRTGEPWSRDYRLIASDGRAVWFRDLATLVRDDDGAPRYWHGVQIDITTLKDVEEELRRTKDELERRVQERTSALEEANELMSLEIGERRRAEAELTEAERRYRTLVEQLPAIVYVEEPSTEPGESHFRYLSPQVERLLGFSAEELIRDPAHLERMLHPEDRHRVLEANEDAERTGEPFDQEYRVFARDGRVVWLHSRAVLVRDAVGDPRYWHGVALDVSERKRAEETLRQMEARYQDLASRAFRSLGIQADEPGPDLGSRS